MKILINAIRLNSAGGLRVGSNLLKGLNTIIDENDEFVFLCSENTYGRLESHQIEKKYIPENYLKTVNWVSGQAWTSEQIAKFKPDVIFNLCNTPLKSKIPQLLLIQWSYAVYNESYIWKPMPWIDYLKRKVRLYLIKKNYHYVDHLTVQTKSMEERSKKTFLSSKPITVIPSSFDLQIDKQIDDSIFSNIKKNFLYLSSYYYHKNHSILIEVAKLIKARELDYKIQITVDEKSPSAKNLLNSIKKHELEDYIVNLGHIPQGEIDKVFEQAYAIINPSFLESFGLTYLEAASKNKLLLASNLDFVRETMADAALYFNPFEPGSILEAMNLSLDQSIYLKKVQEGRKIIEKWPSWEEVSYSYYKLLNELSNNPSQCAR